MWVDGWIRSKHMTWCIDVFMLCVGLRPVCRIRHLNDFGPLEAVILFESLSAFAVWACYDITQDHVHFVLTILLCLKMTPGPLVLPLDITQVFQI